MVGGRHVALLAAATLTCSGLACLAGPAGAAGPAAPPETPAKVAVLTTGLNGPREVSGSKNYFYVAESDTGHVTRVTKVGGARRTVVTGVPVAQGVVRSGSRLYVASGAPDPDAKPPVTGPSTRLFVARPGGKPKTFADLLKFELAYNPDNQRQVGADGNPEDALSNPYYVVKRKGTSGFLVADAGGNDVLAVSKHGKVSTFFVPPSVTTGDCATAQQNSDAGPSCDSVPTGIAYGPDGRIYVSALTGETKGEGRVYVVDANGRLVKTLTGFSGPTGVAVADDGTVYVSELLQNFPGFPIPDGFDTSTIGQIVKVPAKGARTYAQVSQPSGLLWSEGRLYASANAVEGAFGGKQRAGQIVAVYPSSFLPG